MIDPLPRRSDSGSVAVELVLLTPVLILLTVFIVFLGRAGGAIQQVRHAADAGARAASIVGRGSMESAAAAAANRDLSNNGANCSATSVAVMVNGAADAMSVTVTVSCTINGQGTALLAANSRTVHASSTEVVDEHRGGG
ncbi:MAG: TadE family protein [Ilumatobacteraceae bacterium]